MWWLKTKGFNSVMRLPLTTVWVNDASVISTEPCLSTHASHGSAVGHLDTK
jgi:hypothetical protein